MNCPAGCFRFTMFFYIKQHGDLINSPCCFSNQIETWNLGDALRMVVELVEKRFWRKRYFHPIETFSSQIPQLLDWSRHGFGERDIFIPPRPSPPPNSTFFGIWGRPGGGYLALKTTPVYGMVTTKILPVGRRAIPAPWLQTRNGLWCRKVPPQSVDLPNHFAELT